MRIVPKPDKSVPVLGVDGRTMSDAWDEYFAFLSSLNPPAFSKTAPTNGQVLTFVSATQKWTPA